MPTPSPPFVTIFAALVFSPCSSFAAASPSLVRPAFGVVMPTTSTPKWTASLSSVAGAVGASRQGPASGAAFPGSARLRRRQPHQHPTSSPNRNSLTWLAWTSASSSSAASSSLALNMCICINCARVTDCAAYHFVETKHEQPHINTNPTFEPRDGSPTINVTYRTVMSDRAESEYERMVREHDAEEAKAVRKAMKESGGEDVLLVVDDPDNSPMPLFGEEKYDLSPVTTVEYDVVACDDYVEEMGCWVKNMPEEIRLANPDFVPT